MKSRGSDKNYDEQLNQFLGALVAWCVLNTVGILLIGIYLAWG